MTSKFWLFSRLTFIFIFLVIIAGSVVRMTGSGMGCPDWPKCFGHYIPPTNSEDLKWSDNHDYHRKQMIIINDELFYAKKDFTSSETFDASNWEKYTKHNYSKFNVFHTWTEYINRLVGVLLGFFILGMLITSLFLFKKNKWLLIFSIIQLILVAFQAWLGKLTVDSNLQPLKITYHMLGALALIWVQLMIIQQKDHLKIRNNALFYIAIFALTLTIVQVLLGAQVRQEIDVIAKEMSNQRAIWIDKLSSIFKIHRSFAILVVLVNGYLYFQLKKIKQTRVANLLLAFVLLEILVGIILSYLSMPMFAQPTHLLLCTLMFAVQGWLVLVFFPQNKTSMN